MDPWVYLRAVCCLVVAVGYLALLAVTFPRSILPFWVKWAGAAFLLCACIKNIALAFGVYYSDWFVIMELIQATAIVVFMIGVAKMLTDFRAYRDQRLGAQPDPSEVSDDHR